MAKLNVRWYNICMHKLKVAQLKSLVLAIPSEEHRLRYLLGFWHGLRVTEVVTLTVKDILHEMVRVTRLKRSLPTMQPWVKHLEYPSGPESVLSEHWRLAAIVSRYQAGEIGLNDRLFPVTRYALNKQMKRAAQRAMILPDICHPHALKHTCANVMLQGGKNIKEIQKYLGHKVGSSTLIYLDVDEEQAYAGMGELI